MKTRLLALLLLSASAFATTPVTGHIAGLNTTTPGTSAFVRFILGGMGGNQPRITATGAIAPLLGGNGLFYVDLPADASGNISGTIYSTRDAAGTGNGEIEVGGSYTAVYYRMFIYNNGIPGPEIRVHAKNGVTLDIANVTPITTNPVVTAPTGDTTYFRLDGGNSPITGGFTAQGNDIFIGSNTFQSLGNIKWANGSTAGADCGAKINTQDAALGASAGEIWVDQSCGLAITTAVSLSAYHTLKFVQGNGNTAWTYSAGFTLGQDSCIIGEPASFNDDQGSEPKPPVNLVQANNANLTAAITVSGAHACLQDIYIGGNRFNNPNTIGVLVNASRFYMFRATVADFNGDGVKLNSTGTSNQAENFRASQSAFNRNDGDGLNIQNTLDARLDQVYSEFNSRYGVECLNCSFMLDNMSEVSVNSIGGIYIHVNNNSFPFSSLFNIIHNSSFGNNGATCTTATGGDVVIDGHDPGLSTNNLSYLTVIAGNRFVGANTPTANNCDSVHVQDSQLTNVYGNLIISTSATQFRRGIGIFSVSGTEGRDNVYDNTCQGTFSAAGGLCIVGTSATSFGFNNDNGASNFEEFDTSNLFVPNNQALNAKDSSGTVRAIFTPLNGSNVTIFNPNEVDFTPYGNTTPLLKLNDTTPAQATPLKWLSSSSGEFRIINSALSVNILRLTDAGLLSTAAGIAGTAGGNVLISPTAPTIAAAGCGGSAASIANSNGTAAFTINVGTAPTSGGCTVTLPTAATAWACSVADVTTNSTSVFHQKQTGGSQTTAVLVNFSDVAVATAPTASDIWRVSCHAY